MSELIIRLNGRSHAVALRIFNVIVLSHWAEHILQAIQVYIWGWPAAKALGALGFLFPWLVSSEWLHYGYALLMLIGLVALRPGFRGSSRTGWDVAIGIQVWHHCEHLLLLIQATIHHNLLGSPVPTSVLQLVVPRMELHLFYNALVTLPMAVAMVLHLFPSEGTASACSCAVHRRSGTTVHVPHDQ